MLKKLARRYVRQKEYYKQVANYFHGINIDKF